MKQRLILPFMFSLLFFLFLTSFPAYALGIGDLGASSQLEVISAPKNLRIQSLTNVNQDTMKVVFAWDSSEKIFRIYSKNEGATDFESLGYTQTNPLEITFPVLRPYFKISISAFKQSTNSAFESKKSNEVLVTWERPKLSAPTGLNISKIETKGDMTTANITWNPVENAEKYAIYYIGIEGAKEKIGETNETQTNLTYPTFGSPFAVSITALYTYGEGLFAKPVDIQRSAALSPTATPIVKPPSSPPSIPANLRIISNFIKDQTKEIELGWERTDNAAGYNIYIAVSGSYQKLNSVLGNKAVLKVPSDFVSFKAVVTAFNDQGESGRSNPVEVEGRKEEIAIILPTDAPTSVPSPTPTASPNEEDVLSAFTVEEKPESKEQILVDAKPSASISKTPDDKSEDLQNQQNTIIRLITAILEQILSFLKK